jgi:hypothetical protein
MTYRILTPPTENKQPRTDVLALDWLTPDRAARIVEGWIVDPIDHWRKQKKQFDRVWPKAPVELPPHLRLAGETVERVAGRIEALGYAVAPTTGNASWDLEVEGCLRVEVKASAWKEQKPTGTHRLPRHRYQANIRAKQAAQIDLVIFVAVNGRDHHFIIPRAELRGRRSLTIRVYNPDAYTGSLAQFREAWHLVGPALDAARLRPVQGRFEI